MKGLMHSFYFDDHARRFHSPSYDSEALLEKRLLTLELGQLELIRYLVLCLNTGRTALHWAASVNSLKVTKELQRNGANINAPDKKV